MNKYYITTALPYVNSAPHLGFVLEIIQADVLARYHRLLGEDVFFLTGTDEHGVKIVKAAEAAGVPVEKFANKNAQKFRELTKAFNISNDDFIRTTDKKRHWPAVRKVWEELKARGDIYKKKYRGFYCVGHEAFITQKDLVNGKCAIHEKEPEVIEEENYFFKLSKYTKRIIKEISSNSFRVIPQSRKNEILSLARDGFEDVSFSRPRKDLQWGIPVPGDPSQTIYVWADALSNYISALGYAKNGPKFKKYWPADVQCIGKDILRFHAAIWPGMLLALGLPLPKVMFTHGFLTVGGRKMSKSLGNVIDPFALVEKYGVDPARYYLLREIPPTEDGDFTYEKFEERYNADLAKGLGNLVARIVALAIKCKIQNAKRKITSQNAKFINKTWQVYKKSLDDFRFNDALTAVWTLIGWCDKYIDQERPWETSSQLAVHNSQKAIYNLLFTLANIASMLWPFLPETSEKIFQQLGIRPTDKKWQFKVKKSRPLFPRLD